MNITYSKNRFIIECPFSENHLVLGVPNVRFDRRKKLWVAQNLRQNCKYMLDHLKAHLDDECVEVCEKTVSKVKVTYSPFPSWYKFKTEPYQKQREALDRTYGLRRSALFMGMGSGKTKTAIDKFSAHFMENHIECWIIFAPVNVKSTWSKKQLPIHMSIDVPVYVLPEGNANRSRKMAEELTKIDRFILIVGIESMSVGDKKGSAYEAVRDVVINRRFGVTIDESHMVKGADSLRSNNIKHLTEAAVVMNIMTGTPTSQGFIDLYMQFEIMDPNILGFGSYFAFKSRYAIMGGYEDKQIVSYQNVDELMDLISPFVYQCTKEEVVDLPPKVYETVYINMTPEQKKAYKDMDEGMSVRLPRNESEIEVYVEHAMTKYGVLQQITGGFINYDDLEDKLVSVGKDGKERVRFRRKAEILVPPLKNPKIKEVIRLAEENPDTSIIVWAVYRTEIAMLKEALEEKFGKGCCSEYHGGIDKADRDEQERRFTSRETRFMLSNQQTGGAGTTWIESELTVYYSNGFRMLDREQSEDRNHRIGTVNKVVYVDIVAEESKDEDIISAIEAKQDLAQYLRDSIRKRILTGQSGSGTLTPSET